LLLLQLLLLDLSFEDLFGLLELAGLLRLCFVLLLKLLYPLLLLRDDQVLLILFNFLEF